MIKSIFILESSWNSDAPLQDYSVLPIINEFAKQRDIKIYHKVFTDGKSFKHWVEKYNRECSRGSLLYIAAHGNKGSINGLNTRINFNSTVVNTIKQAKNIQFVHFGSCLVGGTENLIFLIKKAKHISWAAGYNKSIDWVDSSLFEILLWSRITPNGRNEKDKNVKTHTLVSNIIENEVKGLTKEFGFNFVYRYGTKIITVSSS